jgi:hypothetical protein
LTDTEERDTIVFVNKPGRSVDSVEVRQSLRRELPDMHLVHLLEKMFNETWSMDVGKKGRWYNRKSKRKMRYTDSNGTG